MGNGCKRLRPFWIFCRPAVYSCLDADRTQAAADGLFFFVDLPAGAYTLSASLVGVSTRYGRGQTTATVTSSNGNSTLATADIAIPSTTIRGQITGPGLDGDGSTPVAMAQSRCAVVAS